MENEEINIPEATKAESGNIKAISKDTVHKICSGQVVLSLAVAVKELVENSIDANSTIIEVKLKDHGLESIEVCDNGSGVTAANIEGMTAKYHTSKIREFVDLQGVETFGFRGEALSSLCALADMTIITRHKSSDVATKLELDHDGNIKKRSPCARSIGTTVTLTNLFSTLPVRKRDFTRNIKKEFTKCCQMLQAYCLVATGVRIICSNQSPKGGKTVFMQTDGAQDVLANITAIFGSRQKGELIPLKSPFAGAQLTEADFQNVAMANGNDDGNDSMQITKEDLEALNAKQFRLDGYISSCSHGAGRSTKDRQYFYINSRPCDPKNIAKIMNDIYHRYNVQQFPFIYLNVITARSDVDVNLTPDKRQLLLHNEKLFLLALKKTLHHTFENIPSTYKMQNSTIVSMFKSEATTNNVELTDAQPISKVLEEKEEKAEEEDEEEEDENLAISNSQRFMDVLSQWKRTGDTKGIAPHVAPKRKSKDEIAVRTLKMQKIQSFLTREENMLGGNSQKASTGSYESEPESDPESEFVEKQQVENEKNDEISSEEASKKLNQSQLDMEKLKKESIEFDALLAQTTTRIKNQSKTIENETHRIDCKVKTTPTEPKLNFVPFKPKVQYEDETNFEDDEEFTQITTTETELSDDSLLPTPPYSQTPMETSTKTIKLDYDEENDDEDEDENANDVLCAEIRTSLAELELNIKAEEQLTNMKKSKRNLQRLRFRSEINPSQNKNAEDELSKEITKDSFARMEILGQFNLGFIIVKLDDADLFIVDQHATDEKYNFEMLQRSTVLQHQPLAVPQPLEMTAVNEMILLDNLDVFEKNGFRFEINENAPPTRKVRLLGKPFSKNWEFGKEDIDELIFMLQDAPPGTICRPSRIRGMFASRACRKSVMIGKALNRKTMKELIVHMGEIEQPWNCPHGRPTMRHLINLAMLLEDEEVNTNGKEEE